MPDLVLLILGLCFVSFSLSVSLTRMVRDVAIRVGFTDKPGHRKIHARPIALGGGIAIFLSFVLPLAGVVLFCWTATFTPGRTADYASGVRQQTPMALALIGAMLAMHLLGLWDDRRALGPYLKLVLQLTIVAALVIPFKPLWSLTALDDRVGAHGVLAVTISVLWIGAITNAFNFLDNMDGLSAGVAAVCTAAFLATAVSIQQWFVAATLALLLGALLGFLIFNFSPASIFMGDGGSLVIGLLLGVLTIRTTYLRPGHDLGAGWYAVFAPVVVLAVPLYDLIVVSIIRLSRGKSPFVGDTNHFSHRLVARGMSRRTAVLCLYLVTAATAIAAIMLPHATSRGMALLIFVQTVLILCVVALLEQHPLPATPVKAEALAPSQTLGQSPAPARAEPAISTSDMGGPPRTE